jgi:hypothetical protein
MRCINRGEKEKLKFIENAWVLALEKSGEYLIPYTTPSLTKWSSSCVTVCRRRIQLAEIRASR